jgi:hypothetical protein
MNYGTLSHSFRRALKIVSCQKLGGQTVSIHSRTKLKNGAGLQPNQTGNYGVLSMTV